MKQNIIAGFLAFTLLSCNQVEEKINQTVQETKNKVEEKAKSAVKNQLNESFNSFMNSEDTQMDSLFENAKSKIISYEMGKKMVLPSGSEVYVFKYKAEKETIIPFLENQSSTDEAKSDKKAKKINGESIADKLSFIGKILPDNIINTGILEELKNNKSIEYYKLKRYPYTSTIIYNPIKKSVLQYVEMSKK